MHTGRDEWIWRPLTNSAGVRLTSLRDESPAGFGLVQRDRAFGNYMDLEAQYHRRPSEWVQVQGDWGLGGVELLEIPTPDRVQRQRRRVVGAGRTVPCGRRRAPIDIDSSRSTNGLIPRPIPSSAAVRRWRR